MKNTQLLALNATISTPKTNSFKLDQFASSISKHVMQKSGSRMLVMFKNNSKVGIFFDPTGTSKIPEAWEIASTDENQETEKTETEVVECTEDIVVNKNFQDQLRPNQRLWS